MKKRLIFIGGAPTTGKTTIAHALSQELSLPWASTDQIRSTLQSVANKKEYPALFNAAGYDAERFLTELSAEKIVQMEMDQAEETWIGVKAFTGDWSWKEGGIIEGVGVLPRLVYETYKDDTDVTAIFLMDHDEDRMRNVVYTRGIWGHAHTYSDGVKEKEVEWAKLFGDKLKAEAEQYGFHWVEVHKDASDMKRIMELVK